MVADDLRFRWERALRVSDLPSGARFVGLMLATFADNDGGSARPGVKKLAECCALTEPTVSGHLVKLRAAGWVARTEEGSRTGRRNYADVYRLAIPVATPEIAGVVEAGVVEAGVVSPVDHPRIFEPGTPEISGDHKLSTQAHNKLSSEPSAPKRARAPRARSSRIPEDFAVTGEMRAWAAEKTPRVNVARETEKFINYWRAKSGQAATKRDWPATWKNWMFTAAERLPGGPNGAVSARPSTSDQRMRAALEVGHRMQMQEHVS